MNNPTTFTAGLSRVYRSNNHGQKGHIMQAHGTARIILQRQGVGLEVNAGCDDFFVKFDRYHHDGRSWSWEVCYGNDRARYGSHFAGQVMATSRGRVYKTLKGAQRAAGRAIWKHLRIAVTWEPVIAQYCHGWEPSAPISDLPEYLVSALYIHGSQLAVVGTGKTVAGVDLQHVATNQAGSWPAILSNSPEAIKEGLLVTAERARGREDQTWGHALEYAAQHCQHQCDLKKGYDHCLQRLAWLASERVINDPDALPFDRVLTLCNSDLTRVEL